ncbi:MAG: non-ribosomal peptide synthetase, partial [Nocardioides sp.]|nr:non-ribosomal peptide synthetase [Nocardioides sp.]
LRDPGQTAQKYIPCPFGAPGSRMYATGDLARWRTDGALEFLGRRDSQLKVRGVRVEASEVEMRLTQIPGIDEAFVCMADNAQGEEVLVAYVGVRDGEFDARRTREKLMPFLPAGLAPAGFVSLHELPKLPNGKIDRSALPDPQLRTTSESRPPATDLERALCALLAESLGLSNIGADDNFFELGGHSLLVAGVLAKVRDTYDVRLSFHDFFSNPTAARLATSVEEQVTEKVLGLPESQLRALFGGGVIE